MIDSDGYVFFDKRSMKQYLVEIKTANLILKRQLLQILATLRMDTTEFVAKSYKGSYSVKPCYRIHILKKGIQQHRHQLISVKLNRYSSNLNLYSKKWWGRPDLNRGPESPSLHR